MSEVPALSAQWPETARKSLSVCFQAISRIGQEQIAQSLETSEPTISRLKNDHLESVLRMLAVAGVKVVHADRVCVKRDEWALMTKIVARAMANEQMAANLLFEEPE